MQHPVPGTDTESRQAFNATAPLQLAYLGLLVKGGAQQPLCLQELICAASMVPTVSLRLRQIHSSCILKAHRHLLCTYAPPHVHRSKFTQMCWVAFAKVPLGRQHSSSLYSKMLHVCVASPAFAAQSPSCSTRPCCKAHVSRLVRRFGDVIPARLPRCKKASRMALPFSSFQVLCVSLNVRLVCMK